MCLPAPASSTNTPVPSITKSILRSAHGSLRGSLLDTISMTFPSTEMWESSTIFTSALKVPSMESYLSRWEACLTPPESLMVVTSRREFSRPCQHLKKLRPIRPNPLMATLILAEVTFLAPLAWILVALNVETANASWWLLHLRVAALPKDAFFMPEYSGTHTLADMVVLGIVCTSCRHPVSLSHPSAHDLHTFPRAFAYGSTHVAMARQSSRFVCPVLPSLASFFSHVRVSRFFLPSFVSILSSSSHPLREGGALAIAAS
mmetsp:Transcript_4810/g.30513  ORF Transcript_4810/g.30513 Transcript_4810/m.30513 type:complete len:261 (+) Transcript_4810:4479-5261(+)